MDTERTFTPREAWRLTGCPVTSCRKLLANAWMRADGPRPEGLTVAELTLLAASRHFNMRPRDRLRFVVLDRNERYLDGPATVVLLEGGSIEVRDAARLHFCGDVPTSLSIYDNRELLAAIEALPVPEPPPPPALTLF